MQNFSIDIPPLVVEQIKEQAYFIAEDKPKVALEWYDQVFDKIVSLEQLPERCPEAPESKFFEFKVHHLLIGEYRILFRIESDKVMILSFGSNKKQRPA